MPLPNCHHGSEGPPQVADEEDGLQIWTAAANIAFCINRRGQPIMYGPPASVLGEGLNSHTTSDRDRLFSNRENRNAYVILMGNPEGKRPFEKPRRR